MIKIFSIEVVEDQIHDMCKSGVAKIINKKMIKTISVEVVEDQIYDLYKSGRTKMIKKIKCKK